jgi:hypothetical protein
MKTIEFKVGAHKVLLRLQDGGGTIETDFKAGGDAEDEGDAYPHAIDGIESLILAHAVAGLEVGSRKYVEGLEAALDALAEKFL